MRGKNSKSKTRNSGKILIVAQDLRLAGLIQEYLSETGYDVACEFNLDAALETSIEPQVDLLIVDGEMPEKVLKDFMEAIARLRPELQIIAVGISEHETESKSLNGLVSAFIEKPFSISDISNTIKEVQSQPKADSFKDVTAKPN